MHRRSVLLPLSTAAVALLAAIAACSSFGNADPPPSVPPQPNDAGGGSLDGSAKRCSTEKAFGAPVEVQGVAPPLGYGQLHPYLTRDESTLVFSADAIGAAEAGGGLAFDVTLMIATRTGPATFSTPTPIPFASPPASFSINPHISEDLLTLMFAAQVEGRSRLLIAKRPTTNVPFDPPTPLVNPAEKDEENAEPRPFEDGLVFRRDLRLPNDAGLDRRIVFFRSGALSPLLVDDTDTARPIPVGTSTLYFAKGKTTEEDIYRASRDPATGRFVAPVDLGINVNTNKEESPGWISDDECVMYFDRSIGDKNQLKYRIFRAERPL